MQKNCCSYPVEFVDDVFGESSVLAETLKKATGSEEPKVFIVADVNVVQRTQGLGAKIGRYVQAHGIRLAGSPAVLGGGEKIKADDLQSVQQVFNSLLDAKVGRNDVVLAIGGGALLDVAGYAAAQVRGGVKLVRMPTTPAAMMDAAFADVAAVDYMSVKDVLRVPSVPAAVLIDCRFAATLLDGVWRGGIGEAVRQAVALDAALWKKLAKQAEAYVARDPAAYEEVVRATVASRRKKGGSSFAQWSALRLESLSGYKLPHGYAVAIAICIDLGYAVGKGLLTAADREAVVGFLGRCGVLDGLGHSVHLLNQPDSVLHGLDGWTLTNGSPAVVVPTALGKSAPEEAPDRDLFARVIRELVSVPATA